MIHHSNQSIIIINSSQLRRENVREIKMLIYRIKVCRIKTKVHILSRDQMLNI